MINLRSIKIPTLQDRKNFPLRVYTDLHPKHLWKCTRRGSIPRLGVGLCRMAAASGTRRWLRAQLQGQPLADPRHSDGLGSIWGGWLLLPLSWGCGGVWEAWLRAAPWVRCSEGAGSWGSGMSGCPNGCASLRSQRPPGSTGVGDTVCSEQPPHPHPIPIPIPSYPHPPAQGEERVLPPGPRPSPAEPRSVLGQPWQRTELSPHTTTSAPIPAGGMEGTALP